MDTNSTQESLQTLNYSIISTAGVEDQIDCSLFKFVLYGIICGMVCICGFAGNSLSFFVLVKDQSSPVACFLLQSLAVADNCFLLLWCIHYSIRQFYKYFTKTTTTGFMYFRLYTFPILYMAQMQTIWLTVIIALNRFMAVCLPYHAPHFCSINNVYKEVLTTTILSIAYNIPKYFEITITHENGNVNWNYTAMGNNATYRLIYNDIMYYLFTFILPLLIMAIVNTKVIITFQAIRRRRQRMTTRRRDNDNNITLVMIIVVVVFMVCQAPARIVQIVYKYYFTSCMQPAFFLTHISNTFEVLNSSVNFIIYAIFRKRFCNILGETLCLDSFKRHRHSMKGNQTITEGLPLTENCQTPHSSKKNKTLNGQNELPIANV